MPAFALMSLRSRKYGDDWRPVWEFLGRRYGVPGPLGLDEAVDRLATELEASQSFVPGQAAPTVFELIGDAHQIGLRQDHVARLARVVSEDDRQRLSLLEHASSHLNWDSTDLYAWDEVVAADPIDEGGGPQSQVSQTTETSEDDSAGSQQSSEEPAVPPPTAHEDGGTIGDEPPQPPGPPQDATAHGDGAVSAPAADDEAPKFPELKRVPGVANVSLSQWTTQLHADGLTAMAPLPDAPSCSATEVTGAGLDGKATTVYGRFEISGKVSDLAYATDPGNWPTCSWFFISMLEQGPRKGLLPPDAGGGTAYVVDLEEKVGLEDVLTVQTGLTTRYFVGNDSVGMEFDLTPGTHGDGKIDVDHGFLLAEKHPTKPGTLVVTSQKTFSFVGLEDLPFSFLCEFGWIDMMRAMAQCRAPGG